MCNMINPFKTWTAVLCVVISLMWLSKESAADPFGIGPNAFNIEFVTIGNPGNDADTTGDPNPAGSVGYSYRMGKYEVSEDAINKANTLGMLGITQDTVGADKPATSVSWNEAARFVNWLNTSTGSTAAYKFEHQPGDIGYSSNANILLWVFGDTGFNASNPFRNSQARYFLPSFDEWYKAAYYDPTSGTYFDYPTGSNDVPAAVASGTGAGTAVFDQSFAQGPADVMDAGGLSPYGTMGQGGNVFEWQESESDLVNDSSSSARGLRGGSWDDISDFLQSSLRLNFNPTNESIYVGFRVASIPEPSSLLLGSLALLGALMRRKR